MRRWMAAAALLLAATGALAAEVGGIRLADKASVGGQELVLNGAGIRTRAIFKVYVASLYLPAKAADPAGVLGKAPRRMQLNLLRDVTAAQLVDSLLDGLKANNSDADLAAVKPQVDQLEAAMRGLGDLKEGNVVTLDFVDGATRVALDGRAKASIAGAAFSQALTKVWIGERPAQADLKKALLGG